MTSLTDELWVVMPCHNEQDCLEKVVCSWIATLRASGARFRFLAVDDGSTDRSPQILAGLARKFPEIAILKRPGGSHGKACRAGYERALSEGARWVLQIDSDGQSDPMEFPRFWKLRQEHPIVYGYRIWRRDGLFRVLVSYLLSLSLMMVAGRWVRDSNVPYRLMRADLLREALEQMPEEFHYANVLLAMVQVGEGPGIAWVPIVFPQPQRSSPLTKPLAYFIREGIRLHRELWSFSRVIKDDKASEHE